MSKLRVIGRNLPDLGNVSSEPDWRQAKPAWIENALRLATGRATGGWMVVDAAPKFRDKPRRYRLQGQDYVFWRNRDVVLAGADACPHMGASLAEGRMQDGCVVCPWHGLRLGPAGEERWPTLSVYDDGVLVWARIADPANKDESPGLTETPVLPVRPPRHLDAVIRHEVRCEPADVIANRLDPWHGVHYHPHSFGRLRVVEQLEDEITVRVVYRVAGPWGVEVDARFHCPDARTIVMTIVDGEGTGSVVETHATPIEPGRSAVIEATLATSDRPGFWMVAGNLAFAARPFMRLAARRLWREDAAYAERRYALRK